MSASDPRVTDTLLDLSEGDTIRVILTDGTILRGRLQQSPDLRSPEGVEERLSGWKKRFSVSAVEVTDRDGTAYETLDLFGFRRSDEWGTLSVRGWLYEEGEYLDEDLSVAEVEVL